MAYVNKLFDFIGCSPTAYHTVKSVKDALVEAGFTEVFESNPSSFADGGKHFVTRGGSSIIAFKGGERKNGFMIFSHSIHNN